LNQASSTGYAGRDDARSPSPAADLLRSGAGALGRTQRLLYWRILAPFVAAMLALTFLTVAGFEVLSAVRAYVGGESLWSKSRSEAVQALKDYAAGGRAADLERFERALVVPAGDHEARIELNKAEPDFEIARAGFLRGGNRSDDIDGMIRLYRYFHDTELMRRALAAWVEGDRRIDELRASAAQVRADRVAGRLRGTDDASASAGIDALSLQLANVEKEFSASLGEASLRVERGLIAAVVATTAILILAGLLFGRRSLAQRVAAERQLEAANRRWKMAADAAGLGVFDWDASSDVVSLDARARVLYGQEGDATAPVTRSAIRERVHPDDRSLLETAPVDESGPLRRGRYRIVHADGTVRHIEGVGTTLEDERGHGALHLIGIVRDVTDEIDKVRLQVERDAAEQVARSRIEFLSRLSHELRTPLNAILGFSQLLALDKEAPPTPEQARRIELIVQGGKQLLRLVEDVLDISSIDSGSVDMRIEAVELQPVLATALAFVEPERERMEVRIENRLPTRPIAVLADARRLIQVFTNLLGNGCKYNAKGGVLSIECRVDADEVGVDFVDEGQGMTRDQMAGLFQPFKRLPNHAAIPSTGMGLVVVRSLLATMGGSVEVESRPRRGSRFRVRLRRAPAAPSGPQA
jgi:signal transduction histidine kinase